MMIAKQTPVAVFISGLFLSSAQAEMYFPTEMLTTDGNTVADLSRFRADGTQVAGDYQVDIYLNQTFVTARKVKFEPSVGREDATRDDTGLVACVNRQDLEDAGVKTELYPALLAQEPEQCVVPGTFIPGAFTAFDFGKMRLDISVPQAAVRYQPRGYISPEKWDDGITAALMNYTFSGNNTLGGGNNDKSYFLGLDAGVNVGPWRLRDSRTWNYYDSRYGHRQQWQRIKTYVERGVTPLRSNLVAGESTTDSAIFDSLAFRGVQLSTDDNMYPDTMRGFAPTIRGIAESNAEVSVRQNGYTIYRTTVPPGPFEINDLSPMYSSGDMEVSVKEASGSTRVFTVPYSVIPSMLREGRVKYGVTAGRLRASSDRYDDPFFTQAALMWGLPHRITAYGGFQYAQRYRAGQVGAGVDMGVLGALSVDVTHADSTLADDSHHQGQSYRFLYSQALNPTGTSFRLTGYQYSTKGFHTLEETALKSMSGRLNDHNGLDENGQPVTDTWSDYYNLYNNKRARFEVNISQSLGDYGSVYLTGVRQTYWNSSARSDSLQSGYSSQIGPVNYTLNYSYTQQKNQNAPSYKDHSISLSLSVPLDKLLSPFSDRNPVYATFNGSRDSNGSMSQQAGLSGSALEGKNLNWNISQGYARSQNRSGSGSGNAGLSYRGGYGNASLGYSYSSDYQRVNYGVSGGVIAHRDGVTFGQPLGETSVLMSADGAPGVGIQNEPGVSTDWRGYAIKPYASAYRENRVVIDTRALDDQTEVESSVAQVVPTKGAIVKADFAVRQGQRLLLTLIHNGKPLPFGSVVTAGESSGIVGDEGQVYLAGLDNQGKVTASWGEGDSARCSARYQFSERDLLLPVARNTSECRSQGS